MPAFFSKNIYPLLYILFLTPAISFCQNTEPDSTEGYSDYIFLPALYYTPETRWAGGVVFQYYFYNEKKDSASRPSSILPIFIYTQNKQVITSLGFDLYLQKNTYHLFGELKYLKYPGSFFGIGNNVSDDEEIYTPNSFGIDVTFLKKIYKNTNAGFKFNYEYAKLAPFEEDGILVNSNFAGVKGGTTSGIGFAADYDTRDNIYYASKGHFYHVSAMFYGTLTGSDYTYNEFNFDLREYYTIYKEHIIVFQGYTNLIDGKGPFYTLSQFGGSNLMRGYFEGRFRDNHVLVLQSEYRTHVWNRFGFVIFSGLGQVAPKLNNFQINHFKYAAGIGLRFMIDNSEKLNIRFDYGIGKDTSGFYIQFSEAI